MCDGPATACEFRWESWISVRATRTIPAIRPPGQFILYPGGISKTEILLAYGGVHFESKVGQLAGNHFLTLTSGLENLAKLGHMTLWEGAQDILFQVE